MAVNPETQVGTLKAHAFLATAMSIPGEGPSEVSHSTTHVTTGVFKKAEPQFLIHFAVTYRMASSGSSPNLLYVKDQDDTIVITLDIGSVALHTYSVSGTIMFKNGAYLASYHKRDEVGGTPTYVSDVTVGTATFSPTDNNSGIYLDLHADMTISSDQEVFAFVE